MNAQAALPFVPSRVFGTVEFIDGEFLIRAEPHVVMRMKRVFPKMPVRAAGIVALFASEENARDLLWFMERYPFEVNPPGAYYRIVELADRFEQRASETQSILSGRYQPPKVEMAEPARQYQIEAAMLAWVNGGLCVGDELGLGKTVTALTMLANSKCLPALIVVQPHLQQQWLKEIHRFLPTVSAHILKQMAPYSFGSPDVIIATYHKLSSWGWTLAGQVRSVVFDEVQELRRTQNLRWSAAQSVALAAKYRMGLTATPIYNYGAEFYNVLECIRPGALGARDEFLREWCTGDYGGKMSIRNPAAFGSYIREIGLFVRRTRPEVGRQLPEVTVIPQTVDADLNYLDEVQTVAAELARIILGDADRQAKFRASGELDYRLRQATGIAKAPYVAAFVRMVLEDSGEPVILYGWHHAVYRLWAEQLKDLDPAWYTGSETPSAKNRSKQRFLNGDTDLMIMSLRSGTGVDGLQERCHRVVFGELDWSPAVHKQCIGRVRRDGQAEPTFAYYLVADDGSDPVIEDALGVKRGQSEPVLSPDAPVLQQRQVDPDHIKNLARRYLSHEGQGRRNGSVPTA